MKSCYKHILNIKRNLEVLQETLTPQTNKGLHKILKSNRHQQVFQEQFKLREKSTTKLQSQ